MHDSPSPTRNRPSSPQAFNQLLLVMVCNRAGVARFTQQQPGLVLGVMLRYFNFVPPACSAYSGAQNLPSALKGSKRCSVLLLKLAGMVQPGESTISMRLPTKSKLVIQPSTCPRVLRSIVAPKKMTLLQFRNPTQKCSVPDWSLGKSNQNVAPEASMVKGCWESRCKPENSNG